MSAPGPIIASSAVPCIARQPILDRNENVFGYDLRYREGGDHGLAELADTHTTIDTLNLIGFDAICDGHLAFIDCTHQMLSKEVFLLLPPDKVVVQVQEAVPANADVIAECRLLKEKKYKIALANYVPDDPREPLVPFTDFIKIDMRKCQAEQRTAMIAKHSRRHCQMLAHKVETREQQVMMQKEGFTLFQGYFFRHPEHLRARHIEGNRASYLQLLQEISTPEVDFAVVEDLIKRDPSLCYRLLRYLNSPLLGMAAPVQSVRSAINLLGEQELLRWIRVAMPLILGENKCSDLVLSALVRARFCELIAPKVNRDKSDLFLVGMLSLMDAILEIPMGMVIEGLALDQDTKKELLGAKKGSSTPLTPIYRLMLAREIGEWEEVARLAKLLNLSLAFANRAYNDAMAWAREMTLPRS